MQQQTRKITAEDLTFENARSVYSGTLNACMCGCSGKHTYNSHHVEAACQHRGYELTADEISDRGVKSILTKMRRLELHTDAVGDEAVHYAYAETATRTYVVYFRNANK